MGLFDYIQIEATYATAVNDATRSAADARSAPRLAVNGCDLDEEGDRRAPGGERWESELSIPMDETIEILRHDDSYAPTYGRIIDEIAAEVQ